jgi:hypothetical protein
MMARQPSRAERSAAKNIKDAKKRGWKTGLRKEEKKDSSRGKGRGGWDVASSAGWTDVTVESTGGKKEKKDGKCNLM